MKSAKSSTLFLYSTAGVAVVGLIAIALNVLLRPVVQRMDLTADRAYTLSDGTRSILSRIDTPVQIHFYFSQSDPQTPIELKTYAARVEDLLNELQLASKGKIAVKKFDPTPDSDAEDSANLDGVDGQQIQLGGDKIYLGLSVRCLDENVTIPFLRMDRERLLEYDLARKIAQVIKPVKPIIGIMSGLQVFGGMDPMAMMRGGGGAQDPWLFVEELKADYEVRRVELTAEKIDDDIRLLLVVYPKGIAPVAEYAIDQFVLRGGKLIAFLDPYAVMDPMGQMAQQNPFQAAGSQSASLDGLLKAWGLTFDVGHFVSDKEYKSVVGGDNGQPQENPNLLSLNEKAFDPNDIATSHLNLLIFPFTGTFEGAGAEGLTKTVLVQSSKSAGLTETMLARFSQEVKPTGKQYPLVVRLTGKFKTAFPNGKPVSEAPPGEEKKEETTASLKESKEEGLVVLFGDADLLHHQFYVQVQRFGNMMMMGRPFSQNLPMVQNLVEFLSGDKDLIGMRSRTTTARPFTRIREMVAKAEERYDAKIEELEKSKSELREKIDQLASGKEPGARIILSQEAQNEIKEVQKKEAEVSKALKTENKNLKKETNSLQTKLGWLNIGAMPLLVTLVGMGLAMVKRQRTAAR